MFLLVSVRHCFWTITIVFTVKSQLVFNDTSTGVLSEVNKTSTLRRPFEAGKRATRLSAILPKKLTWTSRQTSSTQDKSRGRTIKFSFEIQCTYNMRQFCSAEALSPGIVLNEAIKPLEASSRIKWWRHRNAQYISLKHNASWDAIPPTGSPNSVGVFWTLNF